MNCWRPTLAIITAHFVAISAGGCAGKGATCGRSRDARRGRGAARSGWRSGAERCRFARKRGTMITTQIDDLVGRPTGVKTQAFLYVLCGLAEAAVYVALLPLLRSLIAGDYVTAGYLVALAAALALLHSVIGFFADNRGYCIGIEQICHALQDALGDHIVRLPLGWFTKERSGQVAALLTKELQMAMDVPSTFLRQMVIAVTTPAAVVVLFLFVDWRIGLVFVIAAPLLLWASRAMAKAAGEGHRQEELSNAEVAARVLEFARTPSPFCARRSVRLEGWDALQQAIERDRAATVCHLAHGIGTRGALHDADPGRVRRRVRNGHGSFGLGPDRRGIVRVRGGALLEAGRSFDAHRVAGDGAARGEERAGRVRGDIDAPLPETHPTPRSLRIRRGVRSRGLCLRGIPSGAARRELDVPRAQPDRFSGPSGSGKTTLTRLVARFWDVSEGSVSIGGVDVRDMRPDELMQQISLVFQDV